MKRLPRLLAIASLALLTPSLAGATGFSLAELGRLLATTGSPTVPFEETRDSPWLEQPRVTRGTLHASPERLEKRVEAPRPERWELHRDHAAWFAPDAERAREIAYAEAPALGMLANVMRGLVAGDLAGLRDDFHAEVTGTVDSWTLTLRPRDEALAQLLTSIEGVGDARGLRRFTVTERDGATTTTRLLDRE